MKNLCKGVTKDQEGYLASEFKKFAQSKHQELWAQLQLDPDNSELQTKTIAWEYVCQNLGLDGFDWS